MNNEIRKEEGGADSEVCQTSLKKLNRVIRKLNESYGEEDVLISYEFIVMNLFPDIYQNTKDFMTKKYIEGYKKGVEDSKKI